MLDFTYVVECVENTFVPLGIDVVDYNSDREPGDNQVKLVLIDSIPRIDYNEYKFKLIINLGTNKEMIQLYTIEIDKVLRRLFEITSRKNPKLGLIELYCQVTL